MSDRGVKRLARRVASLRDERGLSQRQLAEASGLEVEQIADVEAGETSARLSILRALAKGFGMQVSELLQGIDGPDDGFSIGARVRTCRRAQSLSIEELATTVGLTPEQLERLETDDERPDLEILRALADALGKSVGDFLGNPR